jgi:hypothetical protein
MCALAAIVLAGCHSPIALTTPDARLRASGDYHMLDGLMVPVTPGAEGCGAQSLAAVLAFDDVMLDPALVAGSLPWHDEGATAVELLIEARQRGRKASVTRGTWEDLVASVDGGRPSLVLIDASYEVQTLTRSIPTARAMHWVVVSGMARDGSRILLGAPDQRHHVVRRKDFLRRWERSDYCLITIRSAPSSHPRGGSRTAQAPRPPGRAGSG